ncbi:TauD/TfdA dioxygenase family protein [Novosphingobium malaysiense]|uniref:TauD/TfdA dioxygenase family protein n=1 Tax=Novosphingobium malaysiense TaxID=1348853 RepID=UPI00068E0A35|nr:TauD/TfdA family dioxygenase [Novosphingobium malaysiense]
MATALGFSVGELAPGLEFGARVSGLRLEDLERDDVRKALADLWIDKGVILFRGGESSRQMQVELSRVFGTPEEFPFKESRSEEFPELVNIKYYPEDGTAYEVDGKVIGGWIPWHTDMVYFSKLNRGGILRPHTLPAKGGGATGYADQISAYERLPEDLKARIENLHVVYSADLNYAHARFAGDVQIKFVRGAQSWSRIMKRIYQYPRVIHPMVFTQAETGRKVLNVSPGFAEGVYEMGGPEGDALLQEVVSYCVDPDRTYFHDWEEDDMVLWDNWRTLHCAAGVEPDDTRLMERTTIHGDYALGQDLDGNDKLPRFDA